MDKNLTIKKFHKGIIDGDFSVVEITNEFLKNIENKDTEIGSFLDVYKDEAIKKSKELDEKIKNQKEDLSMMFGVPMAIKDNILIEGEKCTGASKILENYISTYDATVISKLKKSEAVLLGKTNLDEFAMGASTEQSAFKVTKNPINQERVPGGSSGGSASAVAGDMALGALGSDTGGSIRQPAGFCGIVGLKPTYGSVSRYGLMALASSLDQIGPLAKTVEDVGIIFESISGKDNFDSTSADIVFDNLNNLDGVETKDFTIGVPKEYFVEGLDKEIEKSIYSTIEKFKKAGYKIKEISLPHTKYAVSCYYIILPAEASANLARYDGLRYGGLDSLKDKKMNLLSHYLKERGDGFGDEPTRRILLGAFVLSSGYYDAYYSKAQKVRRLMMNDFSMVFDKAQNGVDAILAPVTPTVAFKIGEKKDDPLAMYLSDIFTIPANIAGLPALSLPTGDLVNGLPINFQIIGKHFDEKNILALGYYYENRLK